MKGLVLRPARREKKTEDHYKKYLIKSTQIFPRLDLFRFSFEGLDKRDISVRLNNDKPEEVPDAQKHKQYLN